MKTPGSPAAEAAIRAPRNDPHRRWLAGACGLLVSLPFLAADFPPLTDLPQVRAQVGLFHQALADPEGPYRIRWLSPAILSAWIVAGASAAGQWAAFAIAMRGRRRSMGWRCSTRPTPWDNG